MKNRFRVSIAPHFNQKAMVDKVFCHPCHEKGKSSTLTQKRKGKFYCVICNHEPPSGIQTSISDGF